MRSLFVVAIAFVSGCSAKQSPPVDSASLAVTMPRDRIHLLVQDMKIGESGWVEPFQIRVDENDRVGICKDAVLFAARPYQHVPCGFIRRVESGLVVQIETKMWDRRSIAWSETIPVVDLVLLPQIQRED